MSDSDIEPFPSMRHHVSGEDRRVENAKEDKALGGKAKGWHELKRDALAAAKGGSKKAAPAKKAAAAEPAADDSGEPAASAPKKKTAKKK